MKKKPDLIRIEQRGNLWVGFFQGKQHGWYKSYEEAHAALWNGPIGDALIHYQQQLYLKRIIQRNAEQLRKAMEEEDAA